jgi:F-type H+-transporting ATPase subunit b
MIAWLTCEHLWRKLQLAASTLMSTPGRVSTRILPLTLLLAATAFAQEAGAHPESGDPWLAWKWANFAILVLGLGYLIAKNVPAIFAKRSQEIREGLVEAAKTKNDAEARATAIDKRLAGLAGEIESMRAAARSDIGAEGERIQRETEQRVRRIQEQSAQEIALMSRALRDELRKYSAQLALDLAAQRIRAGMNPSVQESLVDSFVQDMHYRLKPAARN